MKIACICPGTGDAFYCENCVRDTAMAAGLRTLGHDVDIVPMYLPITMKTSHPVMFGAVRLYLADRYPSLKKLPDKILRLLDKRVFLDMAASAAASTRAGGHEEMTISMIEGEEGKFADEFDRMAGALLALRPDVVFVPNAFLIGVLSAVKSKDRSVKTVCMLQDEHVWVDAADQNYRDRTWKAVSQKTKFADVMLAHGNWYRDKIAGHLGISAEGISVIPFGVDPAGYSRSSMAAVSVDNDSRKSTAGAKIGYLSRVCYDLGADILAKAYWGLTNRNLTNCFNEDLLDIEFCGGCTRDDHALFRDNLYEFRGLINFRKLRSFDVNTRAEFLSTLTLLSVPARVPIAFGGFIAESMAAGVPVVQPDIGGFSEVITETGAGLLYSPNTPEALADALERAVKDAKLRESMSDAGIRAAAGKYNHIEMARQALAFIAQ